MGEHSTVCVGIDIGDRYSQIAVLDNEGEVMEQSRIRTTPSAFKHYFQGKSPMRAAMEVGTHSPWMDQLLTDLGHEVILPEEMDTKIRSFIISDHGGVHHGKEKKSPQCGVQVGSNPAA